MHLIQSLLWALPLALPLVAADIEDVGDKPRKFEYTITWEKGSPDGFEREMAFINGRFPGPVVEANQGDNIEIVVTNQMPFNTTIHWHGIEQKGTPWSDGVPGLTQRYIMPGKNFTYKWKAEQYGSYWYHAHARGQIDDGLYGGIIIHPSNTTQDSLSLIARNASQLAAMRAAVRNVQPIILSDWRHLKSMDAWQINVDSKLETPCYDSLLVNGKGQVNCWSQQKINQLTNGIQRRFLQTANMQQMTAKGCLPAKAVQMTFARNMPGNLSAIPKEVFDVCTPTQGQQSVIKVKQAAGATEYWQAFDIVGTFGLVNAAVSMDEHPMYVYAVDGGYIQPQLVQAISVSNADRYSVLVKVDRPGDYTLRVASNSVIQMMSVTATVRILGANSAETADGSDNYITPTSANATSASGSSPAPSKVRRQLPGASSTPYINDVGQGTSQSVTFFSQNNQRQYPADPPGQTVAQTFKMQLRHDGSAYKWALNDTIYPLNADDAYPVLFKPPVNRQDGTTITTRNNTWVDFIFESSTFPTPPHPVHKHGTHMYLIGSGQGNFTWNTVAEAARANPGRFNLQNPPKRDSFQSVPAVVQPSWIAVRYFSSDPGPWLMHCHIQTHLEGGMAMAIIEGPEVWPATPETYLNYDQ
ncbi:hypothetical protein MCOR27_007263 [Pyricularia oryzae]|uniref:Laccase n=1 Tax=Pyricularia grisea TaxID=148305 RepID=A0ABQ8NG43_PYRGI|nr:hypothetical protein MCOR01_005292 [Pyricularia oryzae]KAI6295942.1 hypothetical protein MCOR33_007300 [Pyricularia grisea]KAI6257153.1 hypothetical protein MCOR19_006411 [Pyricularia oryzae]KAI6271760.1 hypothetical protein MCOR26_007677 [Pyricularia oryzae]KAI6274805.1 hypothetical protein MCOR27_007263 [Pyricularia oryzae]